MYKLWNLLFGWDYIWWKNSADMGIARVKVLPNGEIAYWRYRASRVLDVIKNKEQVVWLTCDADKYFS